jgi:hypothetical protein
MDVFHADGAHKLKNADTVYFHAQLSRRYFQLAPPSGAFSAESIGDVSTYPLMALDDCSSCEMEHNTKRSEKSVFFIELLLLEKRKLFLD